MEKINVRKIATIQCKQNFGTGALAPAIYHTSAGAKAPVPKYIAVN